MYQHTSKAPVMSMSLPIKKLKLPWDCKAPIFILPCFGHSQMVVPEAKWRFNLEPPQGWHHPICQGTFKTRQEFSVESVSCLLLLSILPGAVRP